MSRLEKCINAEDKTKTSKCHWDRSKKNCVVLKQRPVRQMPQLVLKPQVVSDSSEKNDQPDRYQVNLEFKHDFIVPRAKNPEARAG